MSCDACHESLHEVSLPTAIGLTKRKALRFHIKGKDYHELSDGYKQSNIRSYLKDQSLFLDFDLHKNRLKHGKRLKTFLISPVNLTAFFNIPWFVFNIINSNLFHMQYTEYCPRCNSKCIKGHHTEEECDYNIEYFHVLDDILNGSMANHRHIYEQYSEERQKRGVKSAYHDLSHRQIRLETFWDITSILLSIIFWLYIIVYISYPYIQVLINRVQTLKLILR